LVLEWVLRPKTCNAMHQVRLYEACGKVAVLYRLSKQSLKSDFKEMKSSYPDATVFVIVQPKEDNAAGPDVMVVELKRERPGTAYFYSR